MRHGCYGWIWRVVHSKHTTHSPQLCLRTLDFHFHFQLESTRQCISSHSYQFLHSQQWLGGAKRTVRPSVTLSFFLPCFDSFHTQHVLCVAPPYRLSTRLLDRRDMAFTSWVYVDVWFLVRILLGGHWPAPSIEQHQGFCFSLLRMPLLSRWVPWRVPVLYVKAKECNDEKEKHCCRLCSRWSIWLPQDDKNWQRGHEVGDWRDMSGACQAVSEKRHSSFLQVFTQRHGMYTSPLALFASSFALKNTSLGLFFCSLGRKSFWGLVCLWHHSSWRSALNMNGQQRV